MRRAAHPSGCGRCSAGAGCSAINYQSLPTQKPQTPTSGFGALGSASGLLEVRLGTQGIGARGYGEGGSSVGSYMKRESN